jgi:acetoin utilization protein AcuB
VKVQQWMTLNPQVLAPEESALDALDRMYAGGFRHLPVVNRQGAPVGIVALDDLRAALPVDIGIGAPLGESKRPILDKFRVASLMTYLPFTVGLDTPLDEAVRQMAERRIGCLPVIDAQGLLVGIFTETDAMHLLVELLSKDDASPCRRPRPRNERERELAQLVADLREERNRIATALEEKGRRAPSALEGTLAEFARERVRNLTQALDRHEHGELGVCSSCRREIPLVELQALPTSLECVRCARAAANLRAAS